MGLPVQRGLQQEVQMPMAKFEECGPEGQVYLAECARTNRLVGIAIIVMLALLGAGIYLAMLVLG
ncbi:MAG: hypothetical protein M9913_05655 [Bryobacteraceae bacterium]|nr:hypothetical protein [Bryobacteraceae bacterium]